MLKFAKSEGAQGLSSKLGFIDQSIASMPFDQQGNRFASALAAPAEDFNMSVMTKLTLDLKPARRLSATFRFRLGKWELDSKSQQDIVRLARLLQSDTFRGQQVILAGFADALGKFNGNTALSLRRAQKVREALLRASDRIDTSQIVVKAYSELMPVDCNTTELGRRKNRRVEVWVRGNAVSKRGPDPAMVGQTPTPDARPTDDHWPPNPRRGSRGQAIGTYAAHAA